jgi:tRNA(Ile)-lysidine synthase
MRGSGLAGLAGIHPVTASGIVRPLLDVTRADVLQFLEARGATWREDSSNRDLRFSRNAIRHELLPQLSARWNPHLNDALAHLADITFEEELWWRSGESPLAAILQTCVAGGIELDVRTLQHLPRALQRRVIRRAIATAKGDLRQVEFEHVERIIDLATGSKGTGRLELPGCLEVHRSFDWVRLAAADGVRLAAYEAADEKDAPQKAPPLKAVAVKIPGACVSPDGKSLIQLEIVDPKSPAEACANLKSEVIRLGPIPRELHLRGWRPGDRYRPRGQTRVRKLKEMFSEARVPSWQRRTWPILISGDEILWSRQFGAAAGSFAEGNGTVLCISEVGRVPELKS